MAKDKTIDPLANSKTKETPIPANYKKPTELKKDLEVVIFNHPSISNYTRGKLVSTYAATTQNVSVVVAGKTFVVLVEQIRLPMTSIQVTTTPKQEIKIPAGIKKATIFTKSTQLLVYGSKDYKDGTVAVVTQYTAPASTFIPVTVEGKQEYIAPEFLFMKDPTYVAPDPLFEDYADKSELMKYMASLLYATNMEDTITLGLQDVDLKDYDMYSSKTGSRWAAIVPKDVKGPIPILMAHCDIQYNVKHPTPQNLSFNPTTERFTSPTGLGADDRAGIFVINRALNIAAGKFAVIFFDEEETGCKGSRNFVSSEEFKTKIDPIASCYISIDRTRTTTGGKTVATYGFDNKDLLKLFKDKVNRPDVKGSSTDCKVLSDESVTLSKTSEGVACVNFSCGYQFEHTARETLYWKEVLECAVDIASLPQTMPELWEKRFLAKKPVYSGYRRGGYNTNQSKSNKANKSASQSHYGTGFYGDEDYILVNGEYYDTEDVKALLSFHKRHSGVEYTATLPTPYTPKRQDFVRLSPDVSVGGRYGGQILDLATHSMLSSNVWIVQSVDTINCTVALTTDDAAYDAVNIPFAFIDSIKQSEPLISPNLLEEE